MSLVPCLPRRGWLYLALVLAIAATLLLVACGASSSTNPSASPSTPAATATSQPTTTGAASKVVQVKIVEVNNQYQFQPATLTIAKGTQVVWTNSSDTPHTVTSDTNVFGTTSNLNANQTFMTTFSTAGTFAYHCSIHTYMKGTITVTP